MILTKSLNLAFIELQKEKRLPPPRISVQFGQDRPKILCQVSGQIVISYELEVMISKFSHSCSASNLHLIFLGRLFELPTRDLDGHVNTDQVEEDFYPFA